MSRVTDEPLDVAIVGAGISGIYAAWRLLHAPADESSPLGALGRAPTVSVFEAGERLGGRLLSPTPPGMPSLRAELGGMRFMSSQPLVSGLVTALGLDSDELPADVATNLVHLRGVHLRDADLADSDKVPYQLNGFERGATPGALTGRALEQIIPRISTMSADELTHVLETRQVNGAHLWEWGFWDLLSLVLSHEGFRFAQKGMGYDTALHNWNAADTVIMNADFGAGTKYFRLRDGYDALPNTLADAVTVAGGEIHRSHRLVSFDSATLPDGTEGVALVVDAPDAAGRIVERTVLARSLVLAMPRRSIELLDQTGPVLGPDQTEIHDMVRSVTPNPLFKAALCYEHPWWESTAAEPGPMSGRAITDLPIRQCYYWGVERDQPRGEPSDNAMLLVYDDGQNVEFWAGFRTELSRQALMVAGPDGRARWADFAAPEPMIAELHRQVLELHGVSDAPLPYAVACVDWGADPYGGGVNFWNPGVKSWEVIPKIARPRVDLPVFIIGEAYSKAQGWVEGALETAELVLQGAFFGLAAPAPTATAAVPSEVRP